MLFKLLGGLDIPKKVLRNMLGHVKLRRNDYLILLGPCFLLQESSFGDIYLILLFSS